MRLLVHQACSTRAGRAKLRHRQLKALSKEKSAKRSSQNALPCSASRSALEDWKTPEPISKPEAGKNETHRNEQLSGSSPNPQLRRVKSSQGLSPGEPPTPCLRSTWRHRPAEPGIFLRCRPRALPEHDHLNESDVTAELGRRYERRCSSAVATHTCPTLYAPSSPPDDCR